MRQILTALGKGNSNFTLASRSLGETPEGSEVGVSTHTFDTLLPSYFKDADMPTRGSWKVNASDDVQYQVIGCQVGVAPTEQTQESLPFRTSIMSERHQPLSIVQSQTTLKNE